MCVWIKEKIVRNERKVYKSLWMIGVIDKILLVDKVVVLQIYFCD